jgi:predicted NBD/HSP70 family sugar kinase
MRAINRFTILHAIRDVGTISRIELSRRTGLSQATVTAITAELLRDGMLLEQERGKSLGGRRPVPLTLNPQGAYTVGVHLSVDRINVVLMNLQANIINDHLEMLDTTNLQVEPVVEKLVQAVHTCLWEADFSKKQISGIGVAMPGLIDSRTGVVHYIPNYQWQNVNLADLLSRQMNIPVYVENSANTLAIFEQWFGAGRGVDNFLLITIENGIGMGMVVNGQLFRGARGIAGEFGHMVVEENGPLCRCGDRGCLEAISGNNAILNLAVEAARRGEWSPEDMENITIVEVREAAMSGNPAINEIYNRAGRVLGRGISNLYKLLDPEKIILSGKGVLAKKLLFDPMSQTLHKEISFDGNRRTRLFVQEWQPSNYARGAGALVLQEVYESPANRVVPLI